MVEENRKQKTLTDLWPRDYGLQGDEAVIGQMILAYLSSVGEEQAEKVMAGIVKPNDSEGISCSGGVKHSDIVIECQQLTPVIDQAAAMLGGCVEGMALDQGEMEPDVHREFEKIGGYFKKINGATASQDRSPMFFDFLYDCYLVTRL